MKVFKAMQGVGIDNKTQNKQKQNFNASYGLASVPYGTDT